MAVTTSYNPATKQATVTVVFDAPALRARADASTPGNLVGETLPEHRARHFKGLMVEQAANELNSARTALQKTDAELDAELTAKQAEITALKASRPS